VRQLWGDLSISALYEGASEAVVALAGQAADPSPHRADEPYRLALELIFDRLSATAQKLAGGPVSYALGPSTLAAYDGPDQFVADLETIRASLRTHGGERLIGGRLATLLQVARACGFHLLAIDMRQNADVHERVVAELIRRSGQDIDYRALDEDGKVALLLGEMAHQRPLRSPFARYSEETARELATLDAAIAAADVVIDFTTPEASVALAGKAAGRGAVALVIGTTGLSLDQARRIDEASQRIAIVRSGSFSLGINMLLGLVEQASRAFDASDFDIEVFEAHHKRKVDAPSGTALMLGEAAARGRGRRPGGCLPAGETRPDRRPARGPDRLLGPARRRHASASTA